MRFLAIVLIAAMLLATLASASVIPTKLTEQKCGNGLREGYELCEKGTAFDICPAIGKLLKIAMVCHEDTCACLPNTKDCGNQIREGTEMCDPGKKEAPIDFCPNISTAIGFPLKCDTTTCDCVPEGKTIIISYCGDKKVEGDEDCESDDDCPKGRSCMNCTCLREEQDLNLTPVQHNVTTDAIPIPTVEQITSKAGKTTIAQFVIEDYVGEVIPEELDYFDDEAINIHVSLKDGTNTTVSLITTEMVVQEIHHYALNDTSINIRISEDTVVGIKAADNRTQTIVHLLADGTITYKPTGFFRRIWFWLFTPF